MKLKTLLLTVTMTIPLMGMASMNEYQLVKGHDDLGDVLLPIEGDYTHRDITYDKCFIMEEATGGKARVFSVEYDEGVDVIPTDVIFDLDNEGLGYVEGFKENDCDGMKNDW